MQIASQEPPQQSRASCVHNSMDGFSELSASTGIICQCGEVSCLDAREADQTSICGLAGMAVRCCSSGTRRTCARGDTIGSTRRGNRGQSSRVASPAASQQRAVSPRAEPREESRPAGEGSGVSLVYSPRFKPEAFVSAIKKS